MMRSSLDKDYCRCFILVLVDAGIYILEGVKPLKESKQMKENFRKLAILLT